MCGICGFAGKKKENWDREYILEEMKDAIRHRGPDDGGSWLSEDAAIGFRRLSIIDLESGAQPMKNEKGDKVLVFNGEIYNYQELREELLEAGHIFTTRSDTEVLIHGYEEWGGDMLNRLRGMFAFVIWDEEEKELFAARDFFGIKLRICIRDKKHTQISGIQKRAKRTSPGAIPVIPVLSSGRNFLQRNLPTGTRKLSSMEKREHHSGNPEVFRTIPRAGGWKIRKRMAKRSR